MYNLNEKTSLEEARISYPRVSDILCPFSKKEYADIPLEVLAHAAERGTKVHAYCTAVLLNDFLPTVDAECQSYLDSFLQWHENFEDKLLLSEKRLYDDKKRFSGQCDFIYCDRFGKLVLVDIKTSSNAGPSWPIQLSAYSHLASINGYEIDRAIVLHLRNKKTFLNEEKTEIEYQPVKPKTFEYEKEMIEYYKNIFNHALECYNYFIRKEK